MAQESNNAELLEQFIAELDSPYINKVDTHTLLVKRAQESPEMFVEKLQLKLGVSVKKYCLYKLFTAKLTLAQQQVTKPKLLDKLTFWKKQGTTAELEQLESMVYRAEQYIRHCGVNSGQVIALVDLTGIPLLAYVLATLNVGGIFTILTTASKTVFSARVSCLSSLEGTSSAIKLMVTPSNIELLTQAEANDQTLRNEQKPFAFEYEANAPACITFDEETGKNSQAWYLSAKELYETILLTGVSLFGTKQTGKLLIPENCKAYYHCSLYLTSLFYGVTPVSQALGSGSKDDNLSYLLFEQNDKKVYLILLDSWAIDLSEPVSVLSKKLDELKIEVTHIFRVRYCNVLLGVTLLSKWYKDGKVKELVPAPGRSFRFANPLLTNKETNNGQGLLIYKRTISSDYTSNDLITATDHYYLYQEWSTLRVDGALYPAQSIIYSLSRYLMETCKGWLWTEVTVLPAHLTQVGQIKLLVLYIDGRQKEQEMAEVGHTKLKTTIIDWFKTSGLAHFSPTEEQLDCAFYYPKISQTSELLIPHWLSGELVEKSEQTPFRAISLLRKKLEAFS